MILNLIFNYDFDFAYGLDLGFNLDFDLDLGFNLDFDLDLFRFDSEFVLNFDEKIRVSC